MQGQAGRWSAASDTLEARAAQVVVLQKGGQACPDWSYTDVTDSELATLCAGILAGRPQCVTEGGELLQINLESSPALTDAGVRSLLPAMQVGLVRRVFLHGCPSVSHAVKTECAMVCFGAVLRNTCEPETLNLSGMGLVDEQMGVLAKALVEWTTTPPPERPANLNYMGPQRIDLLNNRALTDNGLRHLRPGLAQSSVQRCLLNSDAMSADASLQADTICFENLLAVAGATSHAESHHILYMDDVRGLTDEGLEKVGEQLTRGGFGVKIIHMESNGLITDAGLACLLVGVESSGVQLVRLGSGIRRCRQISLAACIRMTGACLTNRLRELTDEPGNCNHDPLVWNLSALDLHDEHIPKLVAALLCTPDNCNCLELHLQGNSRLTDMGAKLLIPALGTAPLHRVLLPPQVSAAVKQEIAAICVPRMLENVRANLPMMAVDGPSKRLLQLQGIGIADSQFAEIVESLRGNTVVTTLDLRGNTDLTDDGVRLLVPVLGDCAVDTIEWPAPTPHVR